MTIDHRYRVIAIVRDINLIPICVDGQTAWHSTRRNRSYYAGLHIDGRYIRVLHMGFIQHLSNLYGSPEMHSSGGHLRDRAGFRVEHGERVALVAQKINSFSLRIHYDCIGRAGIQIAREIRGYGPDLAGPATGESTWRLLHGVHVGTNGV